MRIEKQQGAITRAGQVERLSMLEQLQLFVEADLQVTRCGSDSSRYCWAVLTSGNPHVQRYAYLYV